jgi:hypothetical protein
MRNLIVKVTATIEVRVPDEAPDAEYIQYIIDRKINDWCDGRYPFNSEMVMVGAAQAVRYGVEEAVEQNVFRRPKFENNKRITERNRVVAAITKHVLCWSAGGDRLEITVSEQEPAHV